MLGFSFFLLYAADLWLKNVLFWFMSGVSKSFWDLCVKEEVPAQALLSGTERDDCGTHIEFCCRGVSRVGVPGLAVSNC